MEMWALRTSYNGVGLKFGNASIHSQQTWKEYKNMEKPNPEIVLKDKI
jgi:hypothetical protein